MALPEANDFFGWVAYILNEYGPMLLSGAWKTMVIAVISTAIGCIIGFAVGIVQTIPTNRQENPVHWAVVGFFKGLLNIYVEVFRGTPMMVQAAFIYYGAAMLFDIHMGSWTAALFIVSINTGAYMAETVRGGILSIDPGQTEGAMAHWYEPYADHDQCDPAPGSAQHYAADWQQSDPSTSRIPVYCRSSVL